MKSYPCLPLKQGKYQMVVFSTSAKDLYALVEINRREEDKRKGYQRTLTPGRPLAIAKFIDDGNAIPTNVVISLEKAKLSKDKETIRSDEEGKAGWVIDGQHRLAGSSEAHEDIEIPVTAFLELTLEDQIAQFIIINKEAKKVPTSLYYDLLPELKSLKKSDADVAKEKAVELANVMKVDEASPFFNRIPALRSPGRGQISLTNFVRKISPLLQPTNGILRTRPQKEQRAMIENYFGALAQIFPKEYEASDSIFFRTIGFGGVMNAFPFVHYLVLFKTRHQNFRLQDVIEVLKPISAFKIDKWKQLGTGSAAEIQAGKELSDYIKDFIEIPDEETGTLGI